MENNNQEEISKIKVKDEYYNIKDEELRNMIKQIFGNQMSENVENN